MSSLVTLAIPRDYGYVLMTATASFALAIWHGARVGSYRKAAGVPYPLAYSHEGTSDAVSNKSVDKALEKYLFNCAQRAHANFLESYPIALVGLLVAGLEYPRSATGCALVWAAGRIVYAVGYTSPQAMNGKGRLTGSFYLLGLLGLMGLSGKVGWDVLSRGI